jgi:putative transposase
LNGILRGSPSDEAGRDDATRGLGRSVHNAGIETRQVKYLDNIVEQDRRAVKRVVRPMLGFKSFWSGAATLAGIELMHMIHEDQPRAAGKLRPTHQFHSLAGQAIAVAVVKLHTKEFATESKQT